MYMTTQSRQIWDFTVGGNFSMGEDGGQPEFKIGFINLFQYFFDHSVICYVFLGSVIMCVGGRPPS